MRTSLDRPRFRAALTEGLSAGGVEIQPPMLDVACEHADLLLQWNDAAGLTTITDSAELARRHFLESCLATTLIPPNPTARLLDVGSGGGFPGLAFRLIRPESRVTLLEPRHRKAAFLRAAARLYPPPATIVLPARVEETTSAEPWPIVTLRGVNPTVEELLRVLTADGTIVTFPGDQDEPLTLALEDAGLRVVGQQDIPSRRSQITAWRRP